MSALQAKKQAATAKLNLLRSKHTTIMAKEAAERREIQNDETNLKEILGDKLEIEREIAQINEELTEITKAEREEIDNRHKESSKHH